MPIRIFDVEEVVSDGDEVLMPLIERLAEHDVSLNVLSMDDEEEPTLEVMWNITSNEYRYSLAIHILKDDLEYLGISPVVSPRFQNRATEFADHTFEYEFFLGIEGHAASSIAYDFTAGIVLYLLGQGVEADTFLERAQDTALEYADYPEQTHDYISFHRGNCMLIEGEYEQAAAHLEEAIETFGPEGTFYPSFNLAYAYVQLQRVEEAFELASQVVAIIIRRYDRFTEEEGASSYRYQTEAIDALVRRSQLYALAFRFDEAIADMDAAIELDPDNPELYVERGQHILLLYEWDRALADYNHAIELNPNYADAYYYRGILYASVPEGFDARAEAVADFQHYLDLAAPLGAHTEDAQRYLTEIQAQLDAVGN